MKSQEIRAEYEAKYAADAARYLNEPCFHRECSGIMGPSKADNQLLTCTVCGCGLAKIDINTQIRDSIRGAKYTIAREEETFESNQHQIKRLQEQIAQLKADNKDAKVRIARAKLRHSELVQKDRVMRGA